MSERVSILDSTFPHASHVIIQYLRSELFFQPSSTCTRYLNFAGSPCAVVQIQHNLLKQLTNRFHVAVHLFSNRSQMTSKCAKNKKVAHEAIAECVIIDVLTTF